MKYIYNTVNPWWEGKHFDVGIGRDIYSGGLPERLGRNEQIDMLIGGRGVGKTTILKQIIRHLLDSGKPASSILYLPLHYPAFCTDTAACHVERVRELFRPRGRGFVRYLFVDEIQEDSSWDMGILELCDRKYVKVFCAATMPPPVKGPGRPSTRRAVTVVHPLDFREFVHFRGPDAGPGEPERLVGLVEEYLRTGGYPAQVLDPAGDAAAGIMACAPARYDILSYQLRKSHRLTDFLQRLCASVGFPISYNRLAGDLRLSVDTVKDYLGHLESAWLAALLPRWRSRRTERIYAPKKIYLGDNGIRTVLAGGVDMASRAENAVFLELRRRGIPCGYDGEGEGEVDFVLGSRARPFPVDVRYEAVIPGSESHLAGVRAFIRRFSRTRQAVVVTRDAEGSVKIDSVAVRCIPLWKLLWDGGGIMTDFKPGIAYFTLPK